MGDNMKMTKRVVSFALSLVMLLCVNCGTAFADVSSTQLFTSDTYAFERGITVLPNGDVYAIYSGGNLKGFKPDGTLNGFSASLPSSYCGNLCSSDEGYVFAHTSLGNVYMYNPAVSNQVTTLSCSGSCQSLAIDGNGYFYCLRGETDSSTGNKVAVIMRANVKDVQKLSDGSDINWTKKSKVNYPAPNSDGNAYPCALAFDGAGNAYIADRGSSNGYDASVSGIYRYNMNNGKITAMQFGDAGGVVKLTWVHGITADEFGNVSVVARNSNIIAIFRYGNVIADEMISIKGYVEDLASDADGNVYYSTSGNVNVGNAVFKLNLKNVRTTGLLLEKSSATLKAGETCKIEPTVEPSNATNRAVLYSSSDSKVAAVDENGTVKAVDAGTAVIIVKTAQGAFVQKFSVTVTKPAEGGGTYSPKKTANTLKAKGRIVSVKKAKVKKSNVVVKRAKAIAISGAEGKVTYAKAKGNKKIVINKTNGTLTVKKGLKKGTYKVKIKVHAAGNSKYNPITKTVTVTIKVK